MSLKQLNEHRGFGCSGQTCEPYQNDPVMDEKLTEGQLTEVFVLGQQHRFFPVCSLQNDLVRDPWLHFSHRKDLMTGTSQTSDDRSIKILVG